MKKVILMLSAIFLLLVSCANNGDTAGKSDVQEKSRTSEKVHSSNTQDSPSAVAMKNALMETSTVQFAANDINNDINFKAVGNWSAEDSEAFYHQCNGLTEKENTRLNLNKYCSCLKSIMIADNYRPAQLTTAVKKEQKAVMECLRDSIIPL